MILKSPQQWTLTAAILTLSVSALLSPGVVTAQESDGWSFRITPYIWALGLEGTTAALGNDVRVDADFSDLLDLVNFAFSANMEFNNGKWFVILDPMYTDLEAPIETGGPIGGKTEIELVILDAHLGFNIAEHFDIYAGARYYDQDITIVPNMLPSQALGDSWSGSALNTTSRTNGLSEAQLTPRSAVIPIPPGICRQCSSGISVTTCTSISVGAITMSTMNRVAA